MKMFTEYLIGKQLYRSCDDTMFLRSDRKWLTIFFTEKKKKKKKLHAFNFLFRIFAPELAVSYAAHLIYNALMKSS